jgi:hypothetical protein
MVAALHYFVNRCRNGAGQLMGAVPRALFIERFITFLNVWHNALLFVCTAMAFIGRNAHQ